MANQTTNSSPSQDQISQRAYEIFIERGQPHGQDEAHWLEAEKQLRSAGQPKAATETKTAAQPKPATVLPNAPQLSTDAIRATQPAPSNGNGASKAPGAPKTQARASARK